MAIEIVEGDLLDQEVDAIVNPWNRNTIPWWLLLPQGVSGAIKRRGGTAPFRELARTGRMELGQAVATSAGTLPYRCIIHVAGINDLWRASEFSIRRSARNAVRLAMERGLTSLALPIIGAGSGGIRPTDAESWVLDEIRAIESNLRIIVVRFARKE